MNVRLFGKSEYSEKEFQMFLDIGFDSDDLESTMRVLTANAVYNNAARKCFVENLTGPAVDSLRRCLVAWDDDYINRCTPEWDAMIKPGKPQITEEMRKFFQWLRDRFIYVYGDSPIMDYVQRLENPETLDRETVRFIYARLVNVYQEQESQDYIRKIKDFLDTL